MTDGETTRKSVTVRVAKDITLEVNGVAVTPDEDGTSVSVLSENGQYTIKATDIYGTVVTKSFNINKAALNAPSISYEPTDYVDGVENTVKATVTLPELPEGVNEENISIRYSVDYVTKEDITDVVYDSENGIEITENAVVTAWYVLDSETSASASVNISNIDGAKPTINIKSNEANINIVKEDSEEIYKTSANAVIVSASDNENGSGLKSLEYIADGQTHPLNDENNILTDKGSYEIVATDNAGNKTTKTLIIVEKAKITTAPVVTNNASVNENVKIDVTGDIESASVVNADGSVNEDIKEVKTYETSVSAGQSDTFTVNVTDKYGYTETLTFTIDMDLNDAPVISVNPESEFARSVEVTITYPMGAENATYKIDDETPENITLDENNKVTFTLDKNATITASYKDSAGSQRSR